MHENLKSAADFKPSHSGSNFLEIPKPGVEEMQTREINILHFVKVNHAFVNFLVPCHPGLFLALKFLDHFITFNRVVLAVHGYKIPVKGNGL